LASDAKIFCGGDRIIVEELQLLDKYGVMIVPEVAAYSFLTAELVGEIVSRLLDTS